MAMYKAIEVVAQLAARGVIRDYAVTGAVAAMAYVQPTLTEDIDILISVSDLESRASGLVLLTPIENALADLGYTERTDVGVLVEGWPVQFLPAASELDLEALRAAQELEIDAAPPFKARVLRAEHLVAKAASIGRIKDLARIEALLAGDAVDTAALKSVIERFGLRESWKSFCGKSGRPDPLGLV